MIDKETWEKAQKRWTELKGTWPVDERYKGSNWLQWRTQLQPVQSAAEITAHIKILPVRQPYLYQKLSPKATQLRLLGMSYGQIAKSLNINRKTATKTAQGGGPILNSKSLD